MNKDRVPGLRGKRTTNKKDAKGRVRLQVIKLDDTVTTHAAHTKGNITFSLTLHDTSVGEVKRWLEKRLG